MTSRPVLPLWVPDFLADTGHLTATQVGAYALLLMHAWLDPDASLPNDHNQLARACRIDIRNFKQWIAPAVLPFFAVGPDGRLRQKRLSAELKKMSDYSETQRDRAKKGWETRPRRPVENPVNSGGKPELPATESRLQNPETKNASKSNGAGHAGAYAGSMLPLTLDSESIATSHEAATARAATAKSKNFKNGKIEGEAVPHRLASNAAAKRDTVPRSHTGNPRQAWEHELAKHLGPDLFAKVIPILDANPDICQRATVAERRRPGTGASVAAAGIQHTRRSP